MSGTVWAIDKAIMYAPDQFDDRTLDEAGDNLQRQMLGVAKSKFDTFNIFSDVMEGSDYLSCLAFLSDGEIFFPDLDIRIKVFRGDIAIFLDEITIEVMASNISHKFSYSNAPKIHGSGSKEYEVTALIRDEYRITVMADSEEQALEIADSVSIAEWRHPDVLEDAHLNDRRVIRHARWGNLEVREM